MLALLAVVAIAANPHSELTAAVADLRTLPPAVQVSTRYASLYNVPEVERAETIAALSFALNTVSRSSLIRRPVIVPGTSLLRYDLRWYAARDADYIEFAAAYEKLVEDDPYWHLKTSVILPGKKTPQTVTVDGGWLNPASVSLLRRYSGSAGGILRADWLSARLVSPPHYNRLAGVPPKEADFFKLLGVDGKVIAKLRADEGANILVSGVTGDVRRLVRRQGPLGGCWTTYDVADSTAERDPFRNPFGFDYEAGEHIAAKANGLHLFGLYNRQGERQDAVPDVIAKDTSDIHGKGIVVSAISCIRCHVEDGLRPFANDQRKLYEAGVITYTDTVENAERLEQFYGARKLEQNLERDRADYANAVAEATGLTVPAAAGALARVYRRAVDDLVTPETALRELGAKTLEPLKRSSDPVLLALAAGISVQREQWESSWQTAALLVGGGR